MDTPSRTEDTNNDNPKFTAAPATWEPTTIGMTAAQAMSWIAFGKCIPLRLWGKVLYTFSYPWPVNPATFYDPICGADKSTNFYGGPASLLSMLEEIEAGRQPNPRILDTFRTLDEVKTIATTLGSYATDDSYEEIIAYLKNDIGAAEELNVDLREAARKIRNGIADGTLKCAAARKDGIPRAPLKKENWKVGLDIYPDNTIREQYVGVYARFLLFDTADILAIRPSDRHHAQPSQGANHHVRHGDTAQETISHNPETVVIHRRDGRPPKYHWDEFWIEVSVRLAGNRIDEVRRDDLMKEIKDWADTKWDSVPDDATIRRKISALYARINARN